MPLPLSFFLGAWPFLSRHGHLDRGVVGVAHGGLPEPELGVQLVPSYRTNAAQQRGQSEEVNRQN